MKKLCILLLALLLSALPLLAACGEGESSGTSSDAAGTDVSDAAKVFPMEEKYFGDSTVTVLTRSGRYSQQFVPNEEFEGSVINVAVDSRNSFIEEKYGIRLEAVESSRPAADIVTYITAETDDYDLVCDSVYNMVPQVVSNYFYSLNDLLELNRPWWDQNANAYLTLSDKVFFVAGDALFTDDMHTAGVIFNKEVYATQFEQQYGSLYDMVDRGEWTYDVMHEMAKAFARPNDQGNWGDVDAYYGIVTDGYTGATMLTNGSGTVTASKDENGNISLNVVSRRSVDAFSVVYDMLSNQNVSTYAERLRDKYPDSYFGEISNMFLNGHALFQVGYLSTLVDMKNNALADQTDPGVLPIPKFDKEQDGYFCGVNAYQSDVLGIPISVSDNLEATCYLLELLGYYSGKDSRFGNDSVSSAFYETTLKLQSVTQDNDSRMIDLITSSRIYDLGGIFNWGGRLIGIYSSCLYNNQNQLVSNWDSIQVAVETAMEETVQAYRDSIA